MVKFHFNNWIGFGVAFIDKFLDQKKIEIFNRIYRNKTIDMKWLGINSRQNPCDNWAMQEIIYDIKPDFIIETGTGEGGTTLFYATILEKVNESGKVITVELEPHSPEMLKFKIWGERVEFIRGDSVSPEVISAIGRRVKNHKVLVILDSDHTKKHVLTELNLYSNFVSSNSYIVVHDTDIHIPLPNFGPGPLEAIKEFLKSNKNFKIDHSKEKFFLTWFPSGFLKRIKSK